MISVIITVYEQPATLAWLLFSLAHQDYDGPWEVLVTDDGSASDMVATVREAHARHGLDIRYIWQPHASFRASRSRNNAIRCARGNLLVFIDGDIVVRRDFLRSHAELHRTTDPPQLVSGCRRWVYLGEKRPRMDGIDEFLSEVHGLSMEVDQHFQLEAAASVSPWAACIGCNFSVRRGPEVVFNEEFIGWGAEDTELSCRLAREHGYEPVHVPELHGYHMVLLTHAESVRKRYSRSHDGLVNYLRNRFLIESLHPGADFAIIDGMLSNLVLDPRTDRWKVALEPPPNRTLTQVLDTGRDWLIRHEPHGRVAMESAAAAAASAGAGTATEPATGTGAGTRSTTGTGTGEAAAAGAGAAAAAVASLNDGAAGSGSTSFGYPA